tara:strand:- start:40 stop:1341 length:1302 start_codon:yes stop_codon:yes gene_type:complete
MTEINDLTPIGTLLLSGEPIPTNSIEENISTIYLIVFPNGKVYVGKSNIFDIRKNQHIYISNNSKDPAYHHACHRAFRKYGIETLRWFIIDCADDEQTLLELEKFYIKKYKSYPVTDGFGYNLTRGGEGVSGYKFTEEQRRQMSIRQKKRLENPDVRMQMSIIGKKRCENPDVRIQMSIIGKKRFENATQADKERWQKHHSFPFDVFEQKSGQFVGSWVLMNEAIRVLGINRQGAGANIARSIRNNGVIAGYKFHKWKDTIGDLVENVIRIAIRGGDIHEKYKQYQHKKTIELTHIAKKDVNITSRNGNFSASFNETHIGTYSTYERAERAYNYYKINGIKLKDPASQDFGHRYPSVYLRTITKDGVNKRYIVTAKARKKCFKHNFPFFQHTKSSHRCWSFHCEKKANSWKNWLVLFYKLLVYNRIPSLVMIY